MESIWGWVGFNIFVIVMLLLDLGVFHKKDSTVSVKEALIWSALWIGLALLFNVGVYFFIDEQKALDFFTAYLLEKSLSVDNLFVFIMLFSFFNVRPEYQHRVLFWGIFGALIMRAIFIFAGVSIIQSFSWTMYIFGAFLIFTGVKMFLDGSKEEQMNPDKNIVIKLFKKIMPISEPQDNHNFTVRKDGVLMATPLLLCLIMIELSDLIFAVDSIPAVLAVSNDTFIVYTSNIFAILGLRSLYFALSGVMQYFRFLKYGLAGILSFIGVKMCLNEWAKHTASDYHISNFVSLGVIVTLLTVSILSSYFIKPKS